MTLARHDTRPMIIAVDGPAASGKGTLAKRLAAELGLSYLDTGKIYRAVGYRLMEKGVNLDDHAAVIAEARNFSLADVKNANLYQENVGAAASVISAIPEVREVLLDVQKDFAYSGAGAVLDGRDTK